MTHPTPTRPPLDRATVAATYRAMGLPVTPEEAEAALDRAKAHARLGRRPLTAGDWSRFLREHRVAAQRAAGLPPEFLALVL